MPRTVLINGQMLPEHEATISIFDRGFLFADGIYEVSAVVGGRLVDAGAHMARLARSCAAIDLAVPWSAETLLGFHRDLIAANHLVEGGIYLQVTRGAADRNFVFPDNANPTLVMFTQARSFARDMGRGYRVLTVPDLRWKRRDIKSVALLAQVLAKQAAHAAGCDEAWMIEDGLVTEGGSSTAWIVRGGTLISRPLGTAVLPGITRAALLAFLSETGMVFEERAFSRDEALQADEAFVTSATSFVMSVVQIDAQPIATGTPGPVATRLRQIYLDLAATGGALG